MKIGKKATREIEGGGKCPKCGKWMQRFEHAGTWEPLPGRYHFKFWDRCKPCKHIQHYEEAKVLTAA